MTYPAALKQKFVILVEAHLQHHRVPPSYEQVRIGLGFKSKHRVFNLVDCLVREGIIKRTTGRARTIELLASEYHHGADCVCRICSDARYLNRLQLVHAIEVGPPITPKWKGLRKLTISMRNDWLNGLDKRAKPGAKAVQ